MFTVTVSEIDSVRMQLSVSKWGYTWRVTVPTLSLEGTDQEFEQRLRGDEFELRVHGHEFVQHFLCDELPWFMSLCLAADKRMRSHKLLENELPHFCEYYLCFANHFKETCLAYDVQLLSEMWLRNLLETNAVTRKNVRAAVKKVPALKTFLPNGFLTEKEATLNEEELDEVLKAVLALPCTSSVYD